jgi:hypothetical protein
MQEEKKRSKTERRDEASILVYAKLVSDMQNEREAAEAGVSGAAEVPAKKTKKNSNDVY